VRFRLPRSRRLVAAVFALAVGLGSTTLTAAASAKSAAPAGERMPAGFSEHKTRVAGTGIDYVIGGHGPTLVLIHGYPQTWYEWHGIMPALAKHYTVIAPDLPGAGRSDAPASGYDIPRRPGVARRTDPRRAYDALPEGGTLIVYDAMIDDERRHSTYGLMLSLNMLIDTEGGSEYTVADVTRWLRAAGFAKVEARHLIGGYTAAYATK
jgi:pimeloyl-ACP methyl ester carboxylesterase